MSENTTERGSTKVLDLAMANLAKDERAKKAEALTEAVEDNKIKFENDLHAAKKAVKTAQKARLGLYANPNATAQQIIQADDEVALAERTVAKITAIMAARF